MVRPRSSVSHSTGEFRFELLCATRITILRIAFVSVKFGNEFASAIEVRTLVNLSFSARFFTKRYPCTTRQKSVIMKFNLIITA